MIKRALYQYLVLFNPSGQHLCHFMEVSGLKVSPSSSFLQCFLFSWCQFLYHVYVFTCVPELSCRGSSNWSHSLNVISNTLHINFLILILFDRPDSLKHRTHCEIWGWRRFRSSGTRQYQWTVCNIPEPMKIIPSKSIIYNCLNILCLLIYTVEKP